MIDLEQIHENARCESLYFLDYIYGFPFKYKHLELFDIQNIQGAYFNYLHEPYFNN